MVTDAIRRRVRGAVTQLHDGPRVTPGVDCTFCVKSARGYPRSHSIGWAANHALCVPLQRDDEINILVDHTNFSRGVDYSDRVAQSALSFKLEHAGESVNLRRIVDEGIEELTATKTPRFRRGTMPYPQLMAEIGKAHVFMVTHKESCGLTALEAATCGAVVVAKAGCIASELMSTIHSVVWQSKVPWPNVRNMINPEANRELAMRNSWDGVASRILNWLDAQIQERKWS